MEYFNETHCAGGDGMIGFFREDAVFVVRPEFFKPGINRNDQLFYATMRVNELVCGAWLTEEEPKHMDGVPYFEFIGRLDMSFFPDELLPTLEQLRQPNEPVMEWYH